MTQDRDRTSSRSTQSAAGRPDTRQPFVATDLGLVAFLQLRGLGFELDRSAFPTRFLFSDATADTLARHYWDRASESQVPAQAFMVALQGVKSQIFRRGHGPGRRLEITDGSRPTHIPGL